MIDFQLAEIAQLSWSLNLEITRAAGACQKVLGASEAELVGKSLDEALRIPISRAAALDAKARSGTSAPEFVRCERTAGAGWYRLMLGLSSGQASAAVLNLEGVLAGAPPLQISRLSSSLSHEIRNPLSSVKMAVQTLARNTGLSERDQRRLVIANREVRTMERMLWLFSEYGRDTPPHVETIGLRALVQEAAAIVEPELLERKISLRIAGGDDLLRVRADGGRLRPVLAQLFLNVAMGQAEESAVQVRLEPGPDSCRMVLSDPSAVLPAEERDSVFEPFGSMLARGAGLSLAALHRVMLSHGGEVAADINPQGGTGYTLTFPTA